MHLVNIFTGSGSALKGLRLFVDLPSGVMGIGGGWGGGGILVILTENRLYGARCTFPLLTLWKWTLLMYL